jgi:hypothetical protein
MDIIEPDLNTRKLFEIHILEDGSYAAIREHEPLFCFTGSTIEEVSNIAINAFESFKKLSFN